MVPIGIVTRNRAESLDITLRSLSATNMPPDQTLTIFDDASDCEQTLDYYKTQSSQVVTVPRIKRMSNWKQYGLEEATTIKPVHGIQDRCQVVLNKESLGVVNNSKRAVRMLFDHDPKCPAVFLIQDDVIFKEQWMEVMWRKANKKKHYHHRKNGLACLSACKLLMDHIADPPPVKESGITAQCLLITRRFYEMSDFFKGGGNHRHRFDDKLKDAANRGQFWCGVILPFMCQHFGVESLVRPWRGWNFAGKRGRLGFNANPPYATGDTIRVFLPATQQ